MPELRARVSGFAGPYATFNGTRRFTVSRLAALKFAYSIGLPMLRSATLTSTHALALSNYKAFAVRCAIDFTGTSLRLPAEYKLMDPSEKANISYWTGMVFAAILAEQMLNVPRLMHTALFGSSGLLKINPSSRRLADMIGQDTGGSWHVVEAKAREVKPANSTMTRWKNQATTIATINGTAPSTCSYSLALVRDTYSVVLVDPPPDEDQPHAHIEIDSQSMVNRYYAPLLEWLGNDWHIITREGIPLVVKLATFDPLDNEFLFLGLRQDVMDGIMHAERLAPQDRLALNDSYIGADGIVVVTSQSQDI